MLMHLAADEGLLDDDEDRARGNKRPREQWLVRIGIILIALSVSLWLFVEKNPSPAVFIKIIRSISHALLQTVSRQQSKITTRKQQLSITHYT